MWNFPWSEFPKAKVALNNNVHNSYHNPLKPFFLFTQVAYLSEVTATFGKMCWYNGENESRKVAQVTKPSGSDSLRKKSALVAMDARPFRSRDNSQFNEENISRELNKAFVGFSSEDE